MESTNVLTIGSLHLVGLDELRKRWCWIVSLGFVLALLGTVALGSAASVTLATTVFFGWLMIVGGLLQATHAVATRGWAGFFIDLLAGLLSLVVGIMVVAHPAATAITLTLLIAVFLIFSGLFRITIALTIRFHNSIWLVLHGLVNLALGIMIWQQWPLDGIVVIGMFVGIDMLFNGLSILMLGLAVKNLPPAP